jgi:hypothetical protein
MSRILTANERRWFRWNKTFATGVVEAYGCVTLPLHWFCPRSGRLPLAARVARASFSGADAYRKPLNQKIYGVLR